MKPAERISIADEIIKTKHRIDELESEIIQKITDLQIPYVDAYDFLKQNDCHHFLDKSNNIQNFKSTKSILDVIGFDIKVRNEKIRHFEELCIQAWDDHIITSEERADLDSFCRENKIDRTQQVIIESKVAAQFNDGIDIESTIEYYFTEENKPSEEIKSILLREYKLDVDLERVREVTDVLQNIILEDEEFKEQDSELEKTIIFGERKVFLVTIEEDLNSGFEFEIAQMAGDMDDFKVIVNKSYYRLLNNTQRVELITDAICYYASPTSSDKKFYPLTMFLQMKQNVRQWVQQYFD